MIILTAIIIKLNLKAVIFSVARECTWMSLVLPGNVTWMSLFSNVYIVPWCQSDVCNTLYIRLIVIYRYSSISTIFSNIRICPHLCSDQFSMQYSFMLLWFSSRKLRCYNDKLDTSVRNSDIHYNHCWPSMFKLTFHNL